jgi:flagellin
MPALFFMTRSPEVPGALSKEENMGLVINTNSTSMASQRHLATNSSNLASSFERLSSGLRINSASDDAAGMNISTKLTSQVRGLNQAARNVNDAASLLKTAESALSESNNIMQRLRELAVQSGSDTNTAADRQALQSEATALLGEMDRVANQVQYNGQVLLDGSFNQKSFQIGANSGQTLTVSVTAARSTDVGNTAQVDTLTANTPSTAGGAGAAGNNYLNNGFTDGVILATGEINITGNGVTVGVGGSEAADDTFSSTGNSVSAIAKAAAVNKVAGQTGVTATASATVWVGEIATGVQAAQAANDGDLSINGISIAFAGGTITTDAADSNGTLQAAINAVSGQTGVTAGLAAVGGGVFALTLTAADGRNVDVAGNAAGFAAIGTAAATTNYGGMTFSSNDTSAQFAVTETGAGLSERFGMTGTQALSTATTGNDIQALSLASAASSATAVTNLDSAIAQVASSRSDIGALLNRLDSASNTLKIASENTSAARSSIQDVDFASETANFSKNQILQQASASMLAQANVSGQIALSLLGFG